MNSFEYALAAGWLRVCYRLFALLPVRHSKVVFASARAERLEGNLKYVYEEMARAHPDRRYVFLLERYSYTLLGRLLYLLRMMRASYHLATARLFFVDNAYLPVHVGPHRPGTIVIQLWHAAGALKRFGLDDQPPERSVENRFVHKHYDYVIVGSDAAVEPYASALRTEASRVLALGVPRTDFFFDEAQMGAARDRFFDCHPELVGKRIVLYAPTFRGYGKGKRGVDDLDAVRLRARLPEEFALVNRAHPVLGEGVGDAAGFDASAGADFEINELFVVTDVLITDYSSSLFEYALLRKPLVLLAGDLETYERYPGLYLDYRAEMIGEMARDTDDVAEILQRGDFDLGGYDEFLARHCQYADGAASRRVVEFALAL